MNQDFLFTFSQTPGNGVFINPTGTLDPTGVADVTINVPPFPSLVGTTVFGAFAALDVSAPSGVATVSPALQITIQ